MKLKRSENFTVIEPEMGDHITVRCPVLHGSEPMVELSIGHTLFAGQWALTLTSMNGNFYMDRKTGEIVLVPVEITNRVLIFPDQHYHFIRLEGQDETT
jgi:hypothetical protein